MCKRSPQGTRFQTRRAQRLIVAFKCPHHLIPLDSGGRLVVVYMARSTGTLLAEVVYHSEHAVASVFYNKFKGAAVAPARLVRGLWACEWKSGRLLVAGVVSATSRPPGILNVLK